MERITEQVVPPLEVASDVRERASQAVQDQIAAGGRARKTNPKRKALTELGDRQAAGIAGFVLAVHDGRAEPDAVEDVLRSLVDTR
jgi:mono/diheme cytochrome c family protein